MAYPTRPHKGEVTDVLGQPLNPGDLILNVVTSGRSAVLTHSVVLDIVDKNMSCHGEDWVGPIVRVKKPITGKKTEIGQMSKIVRCPDGYTPPENGDDQIWERR